VKAGWTCKPLGELCDVIGGGTPPKDRPDYYGGDIPWATVRDMRADILTSTEHSITAEAVKASATNIIPAGNVVIATRVGLGKVCLLAQDTAVNQDLRGIVPKSKKEIDVGFLFAWFKSISEQIIAEGTGATVQGVKLPFIKGLAVPYPEMEEQRRIVTLLDEAFADIATAKANAEKNLQNARELFESHLDEVLGSQADDHIATTLGTEVDLVAGFAFSSSRYSNNENDIRLLRGDNIMQGYLRWEDVKRWPMSDSAAHEKFALKEGDVVLAMDRPWVKAGLKRAQMTATDLPCLQVQRTARLRSKQNLSADFLFHLTGSQAFSRHLLDVQTGIGVPHISGAQIQDFKFMRPPLAKQAMIATELQKLQEETQRLESIYRQKLTALDDLKNSLLHQAFSGQV